MSRALAVVLVVLAWPSSARADTPIMISEDDYHRIIHNTTDQLDEPVGLRVSHDVVAVGLREGDVVTAVDGVSAFTTRYAYLNQPRRQGTMHSLHVLRGARRFDVLLAIKFPAAFDQHVLRAQFVEDVARHADSPSGYLLTVTKAGKPSGVLVRNSDTSPLPAFDGDIIHRVDGQALTTPEAIVAALAAAADHAKIVVELDRAGQQLTMTVVLDGPAPAPAAVSPATTTSADDELDRAIAQIQAIDATTFTVPKQLVEHVLENPMAIANKARVVPAIHDGKPAGFKLYAIRPDSLFAHLGLRNGDTIAAVNGFDLTTVDKALEIYAKLRDATALTVDIERRGVPIRLEWRVQP